MGPPSPPPHWIIPDDVLDEVALVDPAVELVTVVEAVVPVVVLEVVAVVVAPEVTPVEVAVVLPPEPLSCLQFGDARARSAIAPGKKSGSFDRCLTERFAIFTHYPGTSRLRSLS